MRMIATDSEAQSVCSS